MSKALLTFSDGSTLEVSEEQRLIPIVSYKNKDDDRVQVSLDKSFELWYHIHDALIPCLCEFLANCFFFKLLDDDSKVYSSNAVIKIENL